VRELRVTLETVTPLFLGGADPRGAPELRPPAIRGALRYWLRAILGGIIGDNDSPTLHRLESTVFGSADENAGSASAVVVRVTNERLSKPQKYTRSKPPTGRDYLYWSMDKSGSPERGNYQPPKQFYAPGGSFDLVLSVRPGIPDNGQVLYQVGAALYLLVNLGGLGSRSRRTAGSLAVTQPQNTLGLNLVLSAKTSREAAQQIGAELTAIRQSFGLPNAVSIHSPSNFDIIHPAACKVWILGIWPKSEVTVESIGAALRDFRTRREPDRNNVAKWLNGQRIPTVERAAFGLPIPYRYSDGGPSGTIQGTNVDRRASPLWLKVSQTTYGSYVGIATLFKSVFLPRDEGLRAKTRDRTPIINPPDDYTLIEQWITRSFPDNQEVRYA